MSPHLLKRMEDRRFTEVDLRRKLEHATGYRPDQVTYRRGRPIAAYSYLPRRAGQKSVRTRQLEPGLLVDFGRGGRAIGIEITDPAGLSVAALSKSTPRSATA